MKSGIDEQDNRIANDKYPNGYLGVMQAAHFMLRRNDPQNILVIYQKTV